MTSPEYGAGAVARGAVLATKFFHWGVVQISAANLLVIVIMVVVFVLALVLPFPTAHDDDSLEHPDVRG